MLLLTNKTIEKLQHDLVREGLVNFEGLTFAQENSRRNNSNLATELVKENLISENKLLNFIEDKLHVPCVDLKDYAPDINCLKFVKPNDAKKYNIFPLFKIEDVLTLAMSDPLDLFTINNLFELQNITIEPVVCSENSIKQAIEKYYFNQSKQQDNNWQEKIISDNISDEIIREAVLNIIDDAIYSDCEHIFMERSQAGLNILFNKELKGFIPNLITQRFLFELKSIANIDTEIDDIAQNSKFTYKEHNIITAIFPTKFGMRISLSINKPLEHIKITAKLKETIKFILKKPSFIAIKNDIKDNIGYIYALASYLSEEYSILMVENKTRYELNGVTQAELNQNTGIYFDEILKQVEMQNFDIIFWEKVYTQEQAEKLKLLSKEHTIITTAFIDDLSCFNYIISSKGISK